MPGAGRPRVSVLLPTHDRADVVGLAVQSVLDQTEADFELLVVADGCTDDTVATIARIGDPRMRVFDLPKAPYFGYANRNVALREARGEYVAFAAHDDLLFPDHLRRLIDRLEATGAEWVYSRPLWVSTDGVIVPYATNLLLADELEHFLKVANTIPAACVMYRRTCLERYGGWPEDVPRAADWRHWMAIIEGGGRANFAYERTPTCLHFSARWKQSRHSGVEEVRTWLDIADASPWWPAILRHSVTPGVPEQQVVAAAMRAGGARWVDELRGAIGTVLDRAAWDAIRILRPELAALRDQAVRLRGRVAALEEEVGAGHASLAQTRAQLAEVAEALGGAERTSRRHAERAAGLEVALAAEQAACAVAEATAAEGVVARRKLAAEGQLARAELEIARAELGSCEAELGATLGSRSWRLTSPLRALRRALAPKPRGAGRPSG